MPAALSRSATEQNATYRDSLVTWWPVLAGLLALYLPGYYRLVNTEWDGDPNVYCLIVLVVALWLVWQKRYALFAHVHSVNSVAGTMLFLTGLLFYVFGRALGIQIFEIGSQLPVLAGLLLMFYGWPVLRQLWFPIFFLIFMVPLPGFIINGLTGTLKQHVSYIVEQLLYFLAYPVARDGVMLTIGPYQLLVANACSGLNSMFSLSAMGILYLYLAKHPSWLRNAVLLVSILPIAFAANIVRVTSLLLITYYLGNDAGQGFLHGFASILLFITALLILFLIDRVLTVIAPHKTSTMKLR